MGLVDLGSLVVMGAAFGLYDLVFFVGMRLQLGWLILADYSLLNLCYVIQLQWFSGIVLAQTINYTCRLNCSILKQMLYIKLFFIQSDWCSA